MNHFGINILRRDQEDIAHHLSGKPNTLVEQKVQYDRLAGVPILRDCLTNIACCLWANYGGGDHTLYVGEVEAFHMEDGSPLVYFKGVYPRINV